MSTIWELVGAGRAGGVASLALEHPSDRPEPPVRASTLAPQKLCCCIPCEEGTRSTTEGATEASTCLPCMAGKYSMTEEATGCRGGKLRILSSAMPIF
jgi:hypothetical protein